MIKKKAFIFDMDGTLVDNMNFQYEAWRRFFSLHRAEMTLAEVKRWTAVGLPYKIVTNFFDNRLKTEEVSGHLDQKESVFQDLYRHHIRPISGLPEFLKRAARRNIPLALATGSDHRNIDFTFEQLNIGRYFKVVVGADQVSNGKPDPETFLLAAARLNVAPADCLVFEDSFGGIEAARRAGMQSVALTTMHTKAELENLPGVVAAVDDYTALDPADLLIARSGRSINL